MTKCSKGRHGHVNYRDSKLTRILQPALGGNARTAIICTLSPTRSYNEQSRNTLLFARCAKEVTTNARVNVVMSDKALVKHLQKEVAHLKSELRTPGPACDHIALLRKKDMQIEKLEKEVGELTKQRELAQSRVEDLLQVVGDDKTLWKKDTITCSHSRPLTLAISNSMKALRREREVLRRLMYKRYTRDERYQIYQKWGIRRNSKQRRSQLVHRLWSDPKDMDHIGDSAAIVAKLIRFSDKGKTLKQMFGLSFIPPCKSPRSFSWKKSVKSLL
ncbi:unnamed protein product [Fraxinus pennsylvanica]|uniref:Kinesin motor domain-containing protein n=1 Tax=Fraxinus pennsylvanica TaxID=56036 RepID=A0AAD2EA62_9LAMI|nr:unnamed protein product [Fraxinus pennsylvanica]